MNLSQLADKTGIKRRTLFNMLKDGRFPVQPLPKIRPRRWLTADVDTWMASNQP